MKKSNVILQTAIASALLAIVGVANATSISTAAPAFASELFKGSTPNATTITLASTGILASTAVPANSTVTVMVKLNGGIFTALPTITAVAGTTYSALTLGSTTSATATAGTNTDVAYFQIANGANAYGVGGLMATLTGITVNNAAANLGAATPVPVTATATVYVGAAPAGFANGSALPTANIFDATSAATNVATSVAGVTPAVAASSAFPFNTFGIAETAKIDLTATPTSAAFTTAGTNSGVANLIDLGAMNFTDGTAKQVDGATAYTMASQAPATGLTTTITAPAGFFAALGTTGTLTLNTAPGCGAGTNVGGAASTVFATPAAAAAATSIAIPTTALPASATNYYVCMNLPAISATSVALVPGTPTLAATLAHTVTTTDSNESIAATPLYALTTNGQTYNVRNYVPAAATGYQTFVRVINTGSVSAAVSVALIDDATGKVGTSGVLGTLAPGAAVNFTPAQIEKVTGAVSVTSRPRLQITAPTNGINVQTFLALPSGDITDMTGAQ